MNDFWKDRIQFIRDLEYLRTVFEDHIDEQDAMEMTCRVQTIIEDQLKDYLKMNLEAHTKQIKKGKK